MNKAHQLGWPEVKLGEVATIKTGGTPYTRCNEYYGGTTPWLRTNEVNFNRIFDTKLKITEEGLNNSNARWVDKNSIILALYGATAGKVALTKIDLTTNQACCNITPNKNTADYRFIYYSLYDRYSEFVNMSSGAAQQNLSIGMISNFLISLPTIPEQKSIAEILSSLDDKIDLLHRQNKTLHATAQTLFRQWFITQAHGKWQPVRLQDKYQFIKGNEPGSKNYQSKPTPTSVRFIRVGDMLGGRATNFVDASLVDRLCTETDLLLSLDGTVGRVVLGVAGAYSSGIRKVVSDDKIYDQLGFKYLLFTSEKIQQTIAEHASGSVILHASSSLAHMQFTLPKQAIIQDFNAQIEPIFAKISINQSQIRTLGKLRDILLPKLMGGEVRCY